MTASGVWNLDGTFVARRSRFVRAAEGTPAQARVGELWRLAAERILSHASVLSTFSRPSNYEPDLRGAFVQKALFCRNIGRRPKSRPTRLPREAAQSAKSRTFQRRVGTCANCHALMDPIGFGLENYDKTGGL